MCPLLKDLEVLYALKEKPVDLTIKEHDGLKSEVS